MSRIAKATPHHHTDKVPLKTAQNKVQDILEHINNVSHHPQMWVTRICGSVVEYKLNITPLKSLKMTAIYLHTAILQKTKDSSFNLRLRRRITDLRRSFTNLTSPSKQQELEIQKVNDFVVLILSPEVH